MSFCNALRRRPSCSELVKVFLNSTDPMIRGLYPNPSLLASLLIHTADWENSLEHSLITYDVAVPIVRPASENKVFRAIVLTPSCASERMPQTLERVQKFTALTAGVDCTVFFLPATATAVVPREFQDIQVALIKAGMFLPFEILPNEHVILDILRTYADSRELLGLPSQDGPAVPMASIDVLPYCSLESPMSTATFMALSDMFPSLRHVSKIGTDEVQLDDLVRAGFSEEQAEACISFWSDEWLPK
jgi:hypothetical protein